MRREIKFRIWDAGEKRWFHGGTDPQKQALGTNALSLFGEVIGMGGIFRDQHTDDMIAISRLHDLIPVQYTGLKDARGVEIYEGDIVSGSGIGVVEYSTDHLNCGFILRRSVNPATAQRVPMPLGIPSTLQVIGNIYENAELLRDAA